MTHPRDKYPRTVCDCADCRKPCENGLTGMLAPGDMGRIAAFLDMDPGAVLPLFRASPGAKVGRSVNTRLGFRIETFRIGTIVPGTDVTGQCVFLQPDGRCSIHAVAPFGCGWFDWHMNHAEGNQRSAACLREILNDPEYQRKWHVLASHGLTTEGPEVKRARLRERTGNV